MYSTYYTYCVSFIAILERRGSFDRKGSTRGSMGSLESTMTASVKNVFGSISEEADHGASMFKLV